MIAAMLVRTIIFGVLVGAAALLIETALVALGRPRRFVWLAALVVATLVPVASATRVDEPDQIDAVFIGDVPVPGSGEAGVAERVGVTTSTPEGQPLKERDAIAPTGPGPGRSWFDVIRVVEVPRWVGRLDAPLIVLWAGASLVWGVILVGSAIRLHRSRARWREAMLDGMPVYMSHDVGPALFGFARFGIVVPGWVTELTAERRRMIVAHEREHARAGDPVALLAGAMLVLLQPLNPAVWMMFRRLRLAIEIDCDARVVSQVFDVRGYGELLLDVGERTLTGAAPLAALSEGGSELAQRLRALTRPRRRAGAARAMLASGAAAAITFVAWHLPQASLAATSANAESQAVGSDTTRAIVTLDHVGLTNAGPAPKILIWAVGGPVQIGIGEGPLRLLRDTVRLDHFPAMRFDVTEGHAVVRLVTGGSMVLQATVQGGAAQRFSAAGSHLMLLRGGQGVANGDAGTPFVVDFPGERMAEVTDDALRRIVAARYPGLLDVAPGPEPYVWLLLNGNQDVIASNSGLGTLPRDGRGRLGTSLRTNRVRAMLPAMSPRLRQGEFWGWRQLATRTGDTLHVIYAVQLFPVSQHDSVPPSGEGGPIPTRADISRFVDSTFARLFDGLSLSHEQREAARGLIWDAESSQFDLPPGRRTLDGILAVLAERDAELIALLREEPDRERFTRNAAAARDRKFQHHREYQERFGTRRSGGGLE